MTELDPTRCGVDADALYRDLSQLVVGQDDAVRKVVDAYQIQEAGLEAPGRPLASFLFLGPTGTGKTRLVEALAQLLVGTPQAVLKINCGEYQHGHEIAKLVGSPPGYLGHRETHAALNQENLNKYHTPHCQISFILFDEVEKASDTLWNLLLGITDKANLTLGDNRVVDFSRAMIFLTSNLGSKEISSVLNPRLGFTPVSSSPEDEMEKAGVAAARRKFTPEFINRLDHVIVFRPLGQVELEQILELELGQIQNRILQASLGQGRIPQFIILFSPEAKEFLLTQGRDDRYGARFLKRTLERLVMRPVVNLITSSQIQNRSALRISLLQDRLTFHQEASA